MATFNRADYMELFVRARETYLSTRNKKTKENMLWVMLKCEVVLGQLPIPNRGE